MLPPFLTDLSPSDLWAAIMHKMGILTNALLALTAATASLTTALTTPSPYVGPENGTLVVVGGGILSDSIYQRVIDLAGGPSAPLVVIPTADGAESYDDDAAGAGTFRRLGATDVTVLHTYDRSVANTEAFVAPLLRAKGVWFGGGRQWRLVDAYAGTLTEAAFWDVLEARGGGVIGGSSAGASIQGSFLARGDTASNQILVGDHTVGFGFMRDTAIDQHVLVRNRMFDMFDILKVRPELFGFGCDENTAFVVARNDAEVMGATYCVIYDGGFWSREGSDMKNLPNPSSVFFLLREGDRYDLGARKVVE
ncbi:Uu.00g144180.m01.CDS01 [Anthostomella pinea]|uniref:Uu.00g144180.m01.CDS01 n=1 Tax=Anthostomella pinea TaxID=933095 RepID=A0AAI8YLQ1_9PEZI|nr:Uu.00g144180.m01.CDS01 [Anthostomella pinea]